MEKYHSLYIMNDEPCTRKFRENLFFLSNFYPCQIAFGGEIYQSSEAAYQAQKFPVEERGEFAFLSPKEAKEKGHTVEESAAWNENKLDIMYRIIKAKFEQNGDLGKLLAATDPDELVELNDWQDTFWGVDCVTGEGENNLGKILRKVREEILEKRNGG